MIIYNFGKGPTGGRILRPVIREASASQIETISVLAKKIKGQTEGEAHEWAREIERLMGQFIESYEKQSHRLEALASTHVLTPIKVMIEGKFHTPVNSFR